MCFLDVISEVLWDVCLKIVDVLLTQASLMVLCGFCFSCVYTCLVCLVVYIYLGCGFSILGCSFGLPTACTLYSWAVNPRMQFYFTKCMYFTQHCFLNFFAAVLDLYIANWHVVCQAFLVHGSHQLFFQAQYIVVFLQIQLHVY